MIFVEKRDVTGWDMDVSFEKYFCLNQKKSVSKVICKLVISSGNIVISSGQINLNFFEKIVFTQNVLIYLKTLDVTRWDMDVSFKKYFCLN